MKGAVVFFYMQLYRFLIIVSNIIVLLGIDWFNKRFSLAQRRLGWTG